VYYKVKVWRRPVASGMITIPVYIRQERNLVQVQRTENDNTVLQYVYISDDQKQKQKQKQKLKQQQQQQQTTTPPWEAGTTRQSNIRISDHK